MDFATTSPLQQRVVSSAAVESLAAAMSYEMHKLSDRQTAERCRQHGVRLAPMVVESFGGWGQTAQRAFKWLAHANASRTGHSVSQATMDLYSGLSIILWRANARALLARVALPDGTSNSMSRRARTQLAAS